MTREGFSWLPTRLTSQARPPTHMDMPSRADMLKHVLRFIRESERFERDFDLLLLQLLAPPPVERTDDGFRSECLVLGGSVHTPE